MQRIIAFLNDLPILQQFSSEFVRGIVCGVVLLAAALILLEFMVLIIKLLNRSKRVSELIIPRKDGDIAIAAKALEGSAADMARDLTSLKIGKVKLYRHKNEYRVVIHCSYNGPAMNFTSAAAEVKQKVLSMFSDVLGIRQVGKVDVRLDDLHLQTVPAATSVGADGDVIVEPYRPAADAEDARKTEPAAAADDSK